jgi:hypothetical protein
MNESKIYLHETKGVNPRLMDSLCPVCGETTGVIVLLGREDYKDVCKSCGFTVYGGAKDSCPKCHTHGWQRKTIDEWEKLKTTSVCPKCQDFMKKGVVLISVKSGDTDKKDPYRTGRLCVVKDEAIKRIFPEHLRTDVLARRVCYVADDMWDLMGLPKKDVESKLEPEA